MFMGLVVSSILPLPNTRLVLFKQTCYDQFPNLSNILPWLSLQFPWTVQVGFQSRVHEAAVAQRRWCHDQQLGCALYNYQWHNLQPEKINMQEIQLVCGKSILTQSTGCRSILLFQKISQQNKNILQEIYYSGKIDNFFEFARHVSVKHWNVSINHLSVRMLT